MYVPARTHTHNTHTHTHTAPGGNGRIESSLVYILSFANGFSSFSTMLRAVEQFSACVCVCVRAASFCVCVCAASFCVCVCAASFCQNSYRSTILQSAELLSNSYRSTILQSADIFTQKTCDFDLFFFTMYAYWPFPSSNVPISTSLKRGTAFISF